MPETRHLIFATAGHVDHGKTALIRALTGIDTDRLPEEKSRGITIDLGFASLDFATPQINLRIGIIDVPGHEDFVKNMVAGVGSIDAAMLIVAADDGWMPQTEEHLQILEYLDVRNGIVVLTKSDRTSDLPGAIAAVREKLMGSAFANSPIIPTAAPSGIGIGELIDAIKRLAISLPSPLNIGKPRLAVDRAFVMRGVGTIITGTLAGGSFSRGDSIVVQPRGDHAHVRAMQTHNSEIQIAQPGMRLAMNLPELSVEVGAKSYVHRSDVITTDAFGEPTETIDAIIECSPRAHRTVKKQTQIKFHCGTASLVARLRFADGSKLNPGEKSLARIHLELPAMMCVGDRFILRDASGRFTLAGGVVLDIDTRREKLNDDAHQSLLAQRALSLDVGTLVRTQVQRDRYVVAARLLARSKFSSDAIASAVQGLVINGASHRIGEWIVSAGFSQDVARFLTERIDQHHSEHPEQTGLPLTELRRGISKMVRPQSLIDAAIESLTRDNFIKAGAAIRRRSHQPALPPRLQASGDTLRKMLRDSPLDPPSRPQLAPTDLSQQALKFLILSGEVIELSSTIVISADAFEQATKIVSEYFLHHSTATVAELKTALQSSRRIVVPLLEKMDRDGITRRDGDLRELKRN